MDSPCAACDGRCCVGRSVALGASDVGRLQAALGLPWSAFAAIVGDDDGFRLAATGPRYGFRLRHADDGSCVFAVTLGTTRRCGVHAVRPLSCRVYPWHVALAPPTDAADAPPEVAAVLPPTDAAVLPPTDAAVWPPMDAAVAPPTDAAVAAPEVAAVALGSDAACPPPLDAAWRARLADGRGEEQASLTAAVAASAADADARARWNAAVAQSDRRLTVDDYLATIARSAS